METAMMMGSFVHIVLSALFGVGSYGEPVESRSSLYGPAVAVSASIETEPCTGQQLFHVHFRSTEGEYFSYYTRQNFNMGGRYFLSGDSRGSIVRRVEISFFDSDTGLVAQEILDAAHIADCDVVSYSASAYPIVTAPTTPREEVVLLSANDAEYLQLSDAAEALTITVTNDEGGSWTSGFNERLFAVPVATMMSSAPPSE